ncbi:MAG: FAD-binding oxidoreductase [Aestuariivirga sp.]|uniref:NAD(P)/FAD-dependent oxidoreductase n=1 Tax=Aestuariivirga sp. TaxID=2650926 RepID=UPI0030197FE1
MRKIFVPDAATMPKTAEVVVIGGGIVGVATAFWLSRAGLDTVLIEMREGLSTLTTPLSIESFRAQMTEKAMADLVLPSIRMYENFADTVGIPGHDIALKHQGYLFVSDDVVNAERLKQAVAVHHGYGVAGSEFLAADDIRQRFPYISERMVCGTFHQNDGWLSSHEATQGFAKGSTAKFLLQTKVSGIDTDAEGICAVRTTRGSIATRQVVNAAGPFAQSIAAMVGVTLPIEAVRRQKVHVAPKPQIPRAAPLCIDVGQETYWRPEHGGALMAWVDPDEPVTANPVEDVPTDWDFAAVLLDKITALSPFWAGVAETLSSSDLTTTAGYYMYTPDDQPLIGPVPEVKGLHLNCGYWAGVMLSPEAGRRVARLLTGEMQPTDNPLRLSRFAEGLVSTGDSFLRGRH